MCIPHVATFIRLVMLCCWSTCEFTVWLQLTFVWAMPRVSINVLGHQLFKVSFKQLEFVFIFGRFRKSVLSNLNLCLFVFIYGGFKNSPE